MIINERPTPAYSKQSLIGLTGEVLNSDSPGKSYVNSLDPAVIRGYIGFWDGNSTERFVQKSAEEVRRLKSLKAS